MEMLGPLAGLAGVAIQSGWQGLAMAIQLQNMRNQQRNADRQFRFAGAGRSDAYGNKQRYDQLLNEWLTELTPTQKKITSAGEKEQLLSLTEDADRNRAIKRRAAERGKEAAKDYDRILAGYRYAKPASEESMRGELQQLLAGVTESKSRKGNAEAIRQSIRQGGVSNTLPALLSATAEDMGGETATNLLQARQGAMQEKQQREQAHSGSYLPALAQLAQIMDAGGDAQLRFSNTPEQLMAMEGQQANMILQALQGGGNLENSAFQSAAKTAMEGGPDVRALVSAFSGLGGKGSSSQKAGGSPSITTPNFANNNMFGWNPNTDWMNNQSGDYGGSFF